MAHLRPEERALARSELPPELADLVRRVLSASSLAGEERAAVARELVAHLEDGLADGRSPGELARTFGSPELAGRLIRRARSPGSATLVAVTVRGLGVVAVSALLAWFSVAWRLDSASPARETDPATLRALAATARQDRRARARIDDMARALRAGEAGAAQSSARGAVRLIDSLAARPEPLARLAGTALWGELTAAAAAAAGPGGRGAGALDLPTPTIGPPPVDLAAVSAWTGDFLTRVYAGPAGDGRLTAEGLRVARALKGSLDLPTGAMLLEPVYFARPARLADARYRADRLFGLAGEVLARPHDDAALADFRREVAALSEGVGFSAAAHYPLALVMERVRRAVEAERLLAGDDSFPSS